MIGLLDWIAASWWHTFTAWWVFTIVACVAGSFRPVKVTINKGDGE